jgi:transcriptional regulator with XRE-family HTH domain
MNDILERVKLLCKEKGITVKTLTEEVGVSYNAVYKWRVQTPDSAIIVKMAEALGTTTDYILTGKDGEARKYSDDVLKILPLLEKMNETELSTVLSMAELLTGKKEDKK